MNVNKNLCFVFTFSPNRYKICYASYEGGPKSCIRNQGMAPAKVQEKQTYVYIYH